MLPREVSLCLYRVIQEGLRNIAKHAQARHAQISLGQDNGGLRLIIQDDGLGFDPAQLRRKAGLGLASMRERVANVTGRTAGALGTGTRDAPRGQHPLGAS